MKRYMEVHTPLIAGRSTVRGRISQRVAKVLEPDKCPVRFSQNSLVQINVLLESRQLLESGIRRPSLKRITDVDLAQLDSMIPKSGQSRRRFFKFDREMASIVVYAQMLVEARIARMFVPQTIEELGRFQAIFQPAKRLGLKTKMKPPTGAFG